jgi:hypothetical protein
VRNFITPTIRALILVLVALTPANLARAAIVNITDTTFNTSNFASVVVGGSAPSQTTVSLTRVPNGGITGDALTAAINGPGSFTFDVGLFKTDQTWNPANGLLTGIAYEYWYRAANASEFLGIRLALRQAGGVFAASSTYAEPPIYSSNWQRRTGSVDVPSAFARVSGPGPALDLSPSGAPIELGFLASRGDFASGTRYFKTSLWSFDLTYTPIPAPSVLAPLALSIGILRRRAR